MSETRFKISFPAPSLTQTRDYNFSFCFTLLLILDLARLTKISIENFLFSIFPSLWSPSAEVTDSRQWKVLWAEQPCMVCRLVVFVQILLAIQHSTSDIRPAVSLAGCGALCWDVALLLLQVDRLKTKEKLLVKQERP